MALSPQILRSLSVLCAAVTLWSCAPPQQIYSLDPVDPRGAGLPFDHATRIRFETGEELAIDGTLRIEAERLYDATGQSWPLSAIDSIEFRSADNEVQRVGVESPEDLQTFGELPRLSSVRLRDGREIDLGADNTWSRWSEDRLGIEISLDGYSFEQLSLEQLHTVTLYDGSLLKDTLRSWKFWSVTGGATILVWVLWSRSEDGLAVR